MVKENKKTAKKLVIKKKKDAKSKQPAYLRKIEIKYRKQKVKEAN